MRSRRAAAALTSAVLVMLAVPLVAAAQRGGRFFGFGGQSAYAAPYDGRWTFTRIRYNAGLGGFGRGWSQAWNHDYPAADTNLPLIIDSLTSSKPNLDATNILDLEDREIFRQPILYMWEPGFWQVTEEGAANLRDYLLKGGFIIFDDFEAEQWFNFESQFRRSFPDAQFIELSLDHPVFHTFFDIHDINLPHPSRAVEPAYFGVFEDNDPTGRMMAFINFNSDVAEYWEWSGRGLFPVDTTNDAYKLGVNFMIYALTH
jgi:hypothetical protein